MQSTQDSRHSVTVAVPRGYGARLCELSPTLICTVGTDGYLKLVNPAFHEMLGYSRAELLSRPIIEFFHPDDRQATQQEVGRLSESVPTVRFENRFRCANGNYRWFLWNATLASEEEMLYATAVDITEKQQSLRGLATRLVLAEETERRRIARGLHDDVGQTLMAAKMSLEELLEHRQPGDGDSSGQEIRDLLDHAIQMTRSLSFQLASAVLFEVGLGAALMSLCEHATEHSGIRFQPFLSLKAESISEKTKIVLFRAGRELIRNVVRHSGAPTARLSLSVSGDRVRLTVEDEGCGYDAAKSRQSQRANSAFGLFSIAQQLAPLGGSLEITSSPGHGTRAVASVPLGGEGTEQ